MLVALLSIHSPLSTRHFDIEICVHEHIFWLDISVNKTLCVQVTKCVSELSAPFHFLLVGYRHLLVHDVAEGSVLRQCEDDDGHCLGSSIVRNAPSQKFNDVAVQYVDK